MVKAGQPLILCIDDDRDTLKMMERFLTASGYRVRTTDSGPSALKAIQEVTPDLIIVDVVMPEMDGYEVCARLQRHHPTSYVPIIFVTALGEDRDKARAFRSGAVDYLVKPIKKERLLKKVKSHINTNARWKALQSYAPRQGDGSNRLGFQQFREFLSEKLELSPRQRERLRQITFGQLYSICPEIQVTSGQLARLTAEFFDLTYLSFIDPEDVSLGVFPAAFCRTNLVIGLGDNQANNAFVISNPFNWELLDMLQGHAGSSKEIKLILTKPENIKSLLKEQSLPSPPKEAGVAGERGGEKKDRSDVLKPSEYEKDSPSIVEIADSVLHSAVSERASDIHIEPKGEHAVIRFRIDGDLREIVTLKKNTGMMFISRFKAIAGLDIAEKRKPQDGAFETNVDSRIFKLRLATSSTPSGESLVIRLLEPGMKPKPLEELGMSPEHVDAMRKFTNRTQGLILIVGPTGSGKTTTISSLLANIDCQTRSLISVEDPVEYHIPAANQQQVNDKAGVSFESLLKSSVRQDPDILFIGEVRDQYSAKIALDFASTGHLTITTRHTSNATTAIFRLERLGIDRGAMADTVLCVVAQRLVKKLCPHCKKIVPLSSEEREILSAFTDEMPSQVAHPAGCPRCNHSGYYGREGVFEIMEFESDISEMIRTGLPISDIRNYARERGDYLISNHAVQKVKGLLFSPREIYEKALVEEIRFDPKKPETEVLEAASQESGEDDRIAILLVEDDQDAQKLIARLLENQDYRVTTAEDGIDALLYLGKQSFDLIISDVNMPNLDGFKLLELKNQKGIEAPVILLTSRTSDEDEIKGMELGAMDYIRKPIKKEVLLLRVKNVLEKYHRTVDSHRLGNALAERSSKREITLSGRR